MKIGWDGRLVLAKTGQAKEFHKNLIKAYCEAYPHDEFLVYTNNLRSPAVYEFIPQNTRSFSIEKPGGSIHTRFSNYWFRQGIGESFFKRKVDVYHSFDSRIPVILPPGCKTKRIAGFYSSDIEKSLTKSSLLSFFSRFGNTAGRLRKADLVIVPNSYILNKLNHKLSLPKERLRVIPTLLSAVFFQNKAQDEQYQQQDPFYYLPAEFYLLMINEASTLRSLHAFFAGYAKALQANDSLKKLVIMRKSGVKQEELQTLAAEFSIEKSIFFVPRLNAILRRMLFEKSAVMFYVHENATVYHDILEGLLSGSSCFTNYAPVFDDLPSGSLSFCEHNVESWQETFNQNDFLPLDRAQLSLLRSAYHSTSIAKKLREAYEYVLNK